MDRREYINPRTALINYKNRDELVASDEEQKPSAHVPQGCGGIYSLPLILPHRSGDTTVQETTTIGTTGCSTCVGIYIPIDHNRCFVAHFDAALGKHTRNPSVFQISDVQADSMKLAAQDWLDLTLKSMEQEVVSIQNREDLKARAAIVCTWQMVGGRKGTGFYIMDILCDYFQLEKAKLMSKCSGHHGFVVDHFDHTPQSLHLFGWTRPGSTDEVWDEMAKLADMFARPNWDVAFDTIYKIAYEIVLPWNAGWWARPLTDTHGERPFYFHYEVDEIGRECVWKRGR